MMTAYSPVRTVLRIGSLQLVVGGTCSVLGALVLLAPHRFTPLAFAPFTPYAPALAITLLAGGVLILGAWAFDPGRPYVWVAHVVAATGLLLFGTANAMYGGLGVAVASTFWVAATLTAPLLLRRPTPLGPGHDLFSFMVGGSQLAVGGVFALLPTRVGIAILPDPVATFLQVDSTLR